LPWPADPRPDPSAVGVIFQEASLFPWLTTLDNIEFPLSLRGTPREERRRGRRPCCAGRPARVRRALSARTVRRHEAARVDRARPGAGPAVLLMDEPFAALDEQTRMTMGHELLRIWSTTRKTVVFITHSLTEAVYLADEVLVMSARPGRIIDRIEVTLPPPRTYEMMATDVFGQLRDRIWQQIRKRQ
jgi:NitT/TauT family transport system ATP-binding protein